MPIKAAEFSRQIANAIKPVCLFYGSEPLLVDDSTVLLRQYAQQHGFEERIVIDASSTFDWQQLYQHIDTFSLFSAKKIIEVRLPTGKPGLAGSKVITEITKNLCSESLGDVLLVIICGVFESAMKSGAWVKQIDKLGLVVDHSSIPTAQMGAWITQRSKALGISFNNEASRALIFYLEGNLLAIDQVIKRFAALSHDNAPIAIDEAQIKEVVADDARFNVFELIDTTLLGDQARAIRILHKLAAEKAEPVIINWAFAREARVLLQVKRASYRTRSVPSAMNELKVWRTRQSFVSSALSRLSPAQLLKIHRHIRLIDSAVKGHDLSGHMSNVWHEFERLIAMLCESPKMSNRHASSN